MKTPIKWVGGKSSEIKRIEGMIPEFNLYVEPFVGGGALYFHLEPKVAIINDINEHLIAFYKALGSDIEGINNRLNYMELTKDYYYEMVNKLNNKRYKDETEHASIFYYLNKTGFSGMWRVNKKGEYNTSFAYYDAVYYKELDAGYSELLKGAKIYNTDFKDVLEMVKDREDAFIFLDPPYLKCDNLYVGEDNFTDIYEYIADYLKTAKCKVMLVVKYDEHIARIFEGFTFTDKYGYKYRNNAKTEKKHSHIMITNYTAGA